jgi:hypothetical protein
MSIIVQLNYNNITNNNSPVWDIQRYKNTGQPLASMTETLSHKAWGLYGPCQPSSGPETLHHYYQQTLIITCGVCSQHTLVNTLLYHLLIQHTPRVLALVFENHCLGNPGSRGTFLIYCLVCCFKTVLEVPFPPSSGQPFNIKSIIRVRLSWVPNRLRGVSPVWHMLHWYRVLHLFICLICLFWGFCLLSYFVLIVASDDTFTSLFGILPLLFSYAALHWLPTESTHAYR